MNRATHQLVAGAAVGIYLVKRESATGATTIKPLLGSAAAAFFTNLPDVLVPTEPMANRDRVGVASKGRRHACTVGIPDSPRA